VCCRVVVHSCTCFTIMVQSGFYTATFKRNARYEFLSGNLGELLFISRDWLCRLSFTYIHAHTRFIEASLHRALQRQYLFPGLSNFYLEILTRMIGINFWITPLLFTKRSGETGVLHSGCAYTSNISCYEVVNHSHDTFSLTDIWQAKRSDQGNYY